MTWQTQKLMNNQYCMCGAGRCIAARGVPTGLPGDRAPLHSGPRQSLLPRTQCHRCKSTPLSFLEPGTLLLWFTSVTRAPACESCLPTTHLQVGLSGCAEEQPGGVQAGVSALCAANSTTGLSHHRHRLPLPVAPRLLRLPLPPGAAWLQLTDWHVQAGRQCTTSQPSLGQRRSQSRPSLPGPVRLAAAGLPVPPTCRHLPH